MYLNSCRAGTTLSWIREVSSGPSTPTKLAILLATAVGFSTFIALGAQDVRHADTRLARAVLDADVRDGAPEDFRLESMDGRQVSLSDLADRTVVVNFWATWCPPCIEEMPSLRRLASSFEGRSDVELVAISTDDDWGPVRDFFADAPPNFTVLLDPGGAVARQYGTTKFPETYLIQRGQVRGFVQGPRAWDRWYARAWVGSYVEDELADSTVR